MTTQQDFVFNIHNWDVFITYIEYEPKTDTENVKLKFYVKKYDKLYPLQREINNKLQDYEIELDKGGLYRIPIPIGRNEEIVVIRAIFTNKNPDTKFNITIEEDRTKIYFVF